MKARVFVVVLEACPLQILPSHYTNLIIIDICDIMNDDCDNPEIETQIKLSLIDRNKL